MCDFKCDCLDCLDEKDCPLADHQPNMIREAKLEMGLNVTQRAHAGECVNLFRDDPLFCDSHLSAMLY